MFVLFPGRHQVMTSFQLAYLQQLVDDPTQVRDIRGEVLPSEPVEAIVFAVTSANHSNTRRNPLPFYLRALLISEFSHELSVPCYTYGIDEVGNLPNFSSYTVKRIKHDSEGMFDLTPENTWVVCSTPVLEMYERHGFRILPAELSDRVTWKHYAPLPWEIVERIAAKENWHEDTWITQNMAATSRELWTKYRLDRKVQLLFRDAMISQDGDLTATRDYNTYVRQMDEIALLKYQDTAPNIQPGRIGDIGCAVGSWLKLACEDERLRESDFYGIEVARQLFEICQQRKVNGEFKNPFVFFSQRNAVTGLVFDRGSMNTIHTSSLTHEIESYGGRGDLLAFIRNRFDELAPGGVWINRDVVGPRDKDRLVWMQLSRNDGRNDDFDRRFSEREQLADYLRGLSTFGRFFRFAIDFRQHEGYRLRYELREHEGTQVIQLSLKDAAEFMSRKDYVDNWESEMHETFCFWDFEEWSRQLTEAGFVLAGNSSAYVNEWIVKNRFEGRVALLDPASGAPLNYPVTNMLLVARKPAAGKN